VTKFLIRYSAAFLCTGVAAAVRPATAGAQVTTAADSAHARPLSLDEAVRTAARESKVVRIARNAVTRSKGQFYQARSGLLPQLNLGANYTRTLKSQYEGAFGGGAPADTTTSAAPAAPCDQYILSSSSPTPDRVTGLEQYARCSAAGSNPFGGFNLGELPFGQANAYTIGLTGTQNLFTGGRVKGQIASATAGQRAAEIELTSQQAQLTLDATQAYYDAALSDRLLAIAQAALGQAEDLLEQTQLQQRVGNASEFELLRATVARDNQRPVVLQRQNNRDIAYLRLKQLLGFPLDEPLTLTTQIEDSTASPPGVDLRRALRPDTVTERRAPVREAAENVNAQQGLLRVARAQRFPTLQLSSQYGGVAYPTGGLPSGNDFRANWTVTLASSFPIFSGGRIRGDELVARANLNDARDRLEQSREFAALDARVALSTLRQAEATFEASRGTAGQAQRAYEIADIRYRQGISTQLELNDARNQLSQALANRAQAARDLLVARVRLALLPDLPIATSGAGQNTTTQQQQQQQQLQQQQQQDTQSQAAAQPPNATGVPTF
jgi:outer membrane protein TolC